MIIDYQKAIQGGKSLSDIQNFAKSNPGVSFTNTPEGFSTTNAVDTSSPDTPPQPTDWTSTLRNAPQPEEQTMLGSIFSPVARLGLTLSDLEGRAIRPFLDSAHQKTADAYLNQLEQQGVDVPLFGKQTAAGGSGTPFQRALDLGGAGLQTALLADKLPFLNTLGAADSTMPSVIGEAQKAGGGLKGIIAGGKQYLLNAGEIGTKAIPAVGAFNTGDYLQSQSTTDPNSIMGTLGRTLAQSYTLGLAGPVINRVIGGIGGGVADAFGAKEEGLIPGIKTGFKTLSDSLNPSIAREGAGPSDFYKGMNEKKVDQTYQSAVDAANAPDATTKDYLTAFKAHGNLVDKTLQDILPSQDLIDYHRNAMENNEYTPGEISGLLVNPFKTKPTVSGIKYDTTEGVDQLQKNVMSPIRQEMNVKLSSTPSTTTYSDLEKNIEDIVKEKSVTGSAGMSQLESEAKTYLQKTLGKDLEHPFYAGSHLEDTGTSNVGEKPIKLTSIDKQRIDAGHAAFSEQDQVKKQGALIVQQAYKRSELKQLPGIESGLDLEQSAIQLRHILDKINGKPIPEGYKSRIFQKLGGFKGFALGNAMAGPLGGVAGAEAGVQIGKSLGDLIANPTRGIASSGAKFNELADKSPMNVIDMIRSKIKNTPAAQTPLNEVEQKVVKSHSDTLDFLVKRADSELGAGAGNALKSGLNQLQQGVPYMQTDLAKVHQAEELANEGKTSVVKADVGKIADTLSSRPLSSIKTPEAMLRELKLAGVPSEIAQQEAETGVDVFKNKAKSSQGLSPAEQQKAWIKSVAQQSQKAALTPPPSAEPTDEEYQKFIDALGK